MMDNMLKCLRMIHAAYDADGADLSAWAGRAADELERLAELAESEGTRAVGYLRRARKAEAEELKAAQENDELRAQLERLRGEQAVLVRLLLEADKVVSTIEGECQEEWDRLADLRRAIAAATIPHRPEEADLLSLRACIGA